MAILEHIETPEDIRALPKSQLQALALELRTFIIDALSVKEGHLGASLGVVELTIALHYVFDTPRDTLIWDVGHQAYGHKILTGRCSRFATNRQLGGISGFPNIEESIYDAFGTGHSSTSISAAMGMAMAAQLSGVKRKNHIAVIGDASIVSGMAFEAMNHAGSTEANIAIILNDNSMGIDPSVGALKDYFIKSRTSRNNLVEAFGLLDFGTVDGHDIEALTQSLIAIKNADKPRFLHVVTQKGKGLKRAEEQQVVYHAPGKFDKHTGELDAKSTLLPPKYQDVYGLTLLELARQNHKIVAITPAMLTGSSLVQMQSAFPERVFDVGIAEQHAVTFAAGLATQGYIAFCAIYSTFLQRAYDQVIHDVAIQNLPVVFCIDRAGLVGEDGATHHGYFDIVFFRAIPNIIMMAPMNEVELRNMLYTAQLGVAKPMAIRYPRGHSTNISWQLPFQKIELGKGRKLKAGSLVCVLSIGTIAANVAEAIQLLEDSGYVAHYDMRFVKPIDEDLLHEAFRTYTTIFTVEDGMACGGFGSGVLEFAAAYGYKNRVVVLGIPNMFVEHGNVSQLQELCGLDAKTLNQKLVVEIENLKSRL